MNGIELLIDPQPHDLCGISRDSLFDGELTCFQHQKGYRFSVDSVLVAHFVNVKQNDRILDLGAGAGVISLILMYRWRDKVKEVTGIEVQQGLADLAEKNFQYNDFQLLGRIITGNIQKIETLIKPESYDKIVCNPPFYIPTSGRISTHSEAQRARHQILATLQDFLAAAAFAVKNGGVVTFIYPAEQISCFIFTAEKYRLAVKKIQFVYSYPHASASARLALIQCFKNGGAGTDILPPFYIYSEKNGAFSSEMQVFYTRN